MADVALFYAGSDFALAKDLAERLQEELNPLNIWWDEGIRRSCWDDDVMNALKGARCVIALWSHNAAEMDRQSIMNELVESDKLSIPIVVVTIDDAKLRGPAEKGQIVPLRHDQNTDEICAEVFSALSNGRKWEYVSHRQKLSFPQFVRSVSSHETFASPVELLKALLLHPSNEPILVSSYDVFTAEEDTQEINSLLQKIHAKGSPIYLDSGNYEACRKCENPNDEARKKYRLNSKIEKTWVPKNHQSILKKLQIDFAFQYDPTDNLKTASPETIPMHAITYFESDQKVSNGSDIIPILHLPTDQNNVPRFEYLAEIAEKLIAELNPSFLAIPERELGHGIVQRAQTLNNLRKRLDASGSYRHIHLLGTGNPISIAILAQAGADSFDGLEWCRTVSNHSNGHLFHTQHFDLFASQALDDPFLHPVVDGILRDPQTEWHQKLLLHNLEFFKEWMEKLRFHLHRGTILPLLEKALTDKEIEFLQQQLDGVIR